MIMATTQEERRVTLMGVPIDALRMDEVVQCCERAIDQRSRLHIGVVNAAKIVNMHRNDALRHAVLTSDKIFADGMSVVWAARLLRRPLPERIAGIDLMAALLQRAHERRFRVYCLGATEEVLAIATQRMQAEYPNMVLAGKHHGYFSQAEEPQVAADIAAAKPDLLFVAMTSPKKEQFLARWAGQVEVPICHGVGGSFDVLAGKVRRAPRLWQRLGLEWLYRVIQEPGRMWRRYLVTNTLFMVMLAREWLAMPITKPRAQRV